MYKWKRQLSYSLCYKTCVILEFLNIGTKDDDKNKMVDYIITTKRIIVKLTIRR